MAMPRDLVKQGRREAGRCTEAADLVIHYLEQLGVEFVFGVPGGAIEPLYDALARSAARGTVQPVVARHETGAGFMADGYFNQSGKLAVLCATTGPGSTNLITSVASAYENRIPMLVITAQTPLNTFGKGAFQESSCTGVNTVNLFQPVTRYNSLVSHVEQLEHKLAAAIMTACQSPQGPAHLSIPLDVLRSQMPDAFPAFNLKTLLDRPTLLDGEAVKLFEDEVCAARRVAFVVGDGCAEAINNILDAAVMLDAPVITTPHGKGLVSPFHPLFQGVVGFAGHESASQTLRDPDIDRIVAIGTSLSEWSSNNWDPNTLLNDRLIHVEATEANLTRSPMARLHVRGRVASIFERLVERLEQEGRSPAPKVRKRSNSPKRKSGEWRWPNCDLLNKNKCLSDDGPIKPQRLMTELTRLFPPQTRWFADTGSSFAWAIHYLHPYDRRIASRRKSACGRKLGRRQNANFVFRACLEFASMGWAIGASIGAALGSRGTPVVCITGDGAVLMSGQELTVAVQQQLPVIFVILNDGGLGMVKHGQRLGGAEQVGWQIPQCDFAAIAEAMGATSHRIERPDDLLSLDVESICAGGGPTVLDVRIDAEECPPIGARIRLLGGLQN